MALPLSAADVLASVNRDVERSYLRARNGLRYVRGSNRPKLGATPKDVVWRRDKAQLWRYRGGPVRYAQPLLIVTSLVSRSYILDLLPGSSTVEFLRDQGFDVFMLDWGIPDELDADNRLETYVDEYLPRAVAALRRETGASELTMAGYCLGGVLAILYANGHDDTGVRNLVLMATPVDFEEMGPMVAALREGRLDPEHLIDETGNVPADVLYSGFFMLAPTTIVAQRATLLENLWNDEFVARLPGDGAVDARPGAVPGRGVPRGRRAVRPPQRADGRQPARRRARDRLRDDRRERAQRDGGEGHRGAAGGSRAARAAGRPARAPAASCSSRAGTSRSAPGARRFGTRCRASRAGSPTTATKGDAEMDIRPLEPGDGQRSRDFVERVPESDRTFFKEDVDAAAWALPGPARAVAVADGEVVGYVAVVPLHGWSDHVGEVRGDRRPRPARPRHRPLAGPARGPGGARARPAQAGRGGRRRPGADDRDVPGARVRSRGALTDHVRDRSGELRDLMILAQSVEAQWSAMSAAGIADEL